MLEEGKLVKQTVKMMADNDIHPHRAGKGDHHIFQCAHSGKKFTQDMGNKKPENHRAKVKDVQRHRKSIGKPFVSTNA